jgi:chemotaxis protein MotB
LIATGLRIRRFLRGEAPAVEEKIPEAVRQKDEVQKELNIKVAELSKTVETKQTEILNVQSTKDSLIAEMQDEIQKNQIQITQMADKLRLSIVDKILFPSGEWEISPEGLRVLERVGNILKNAQGKSVRVEGHTDNVPIGGRLKERFGSNWELSAARATNVVRFLQEKVGMDPKRLEAAGLAQYKPVSTNDTREGRAENRNRDLPAADVGEAGLCGPEGFLKILPILIDPVLMSLPIEEESY